MAGESLELLRSPLDERLECGHGLLMPPCTIFFSQFRGAAHLLQAHQDEQALREADEGLHGIEPERCDLKCRHFIFLTGLLSSPGEFHGLESHGPQPWVKHYPLSRSIARFGLLVITI